MTLEAQLLAEIEERQSKLDKIRGVSPKLQALEALLSECLRECNELGMVDLFSSLLGNFFTATTATATATATATVTANTNTANTNTNSVLTVTDKEAKIIRQELKIFLKYEGQRLSDTTIKNLLIEKLEELSKQDLLAEVNLDDKNNFLVEAKKLANLLTLAKEETLTVAKEETLTVAKEETLTVAKEETLTVAKEEIKEDLTVAKEEIKEDLTEAKEETLTTPINPNPAPQVTAEEVNKEDGLNPKDVIKSALVQNKINGYYGTVEKDGVLNSGALVRYPQETSLTPLSELKLIQPAIFITPVIEEIKEEEEVSTEMSLQEKMMWDALLEIFDSAGLSAMATDKETVEGFNLANGTNLTVLPIADLYEYTTGKGRIS